MEISSPLSRNGLSVLMISPQFRPIIGGYERAAERLSSTLVTLGDHVTVISERREKSWPANELINGIVVRRLPCIFRPHLHILSSLIAFGWFLLWQGRRFDVWHIHQYGQHAVLVVLLGKMLGRPVVLKLTSSAGEGIGNLKKRAIFVPDLTATLRRVDACVATSRETCDEALAFGIPAEHVHILGNGIDAVVFHPVNQARRMAERAALGVEASGVVLFVGRLSSEKNPDGLLSAWQSALPQLSQGWKLVLVGEGPMSAALNRYVEAKGLDGSVLFAGYHNHIERWMKASDILVLPSHWEGLSNTMLEAMASGLPVISTKVSGSIEALRETGAGMLVDVGSMGQLAEAMVFLARNSHLRTQMGEAGRKTVDARYSIEKIAASYHRLYRRLVSPTPAASGG